MGNGRLWKLCVLGILLFGCSNSLLPAQNFCIKVNEVQFRPATGIVAQQCREWIELYNTSDVASVNLTGWYLRTDVNNNPNNPSWVQDEIVTWTSRFALGPNDLVAGPLQLNTINIPPQTLCVILTPAWNNTATLLKDIPNNTIVLTLKNASYWGGGGGTGAVPNGLLFNNGDHVKIFDSNPLNAGSQLIDSVVWYGGPGNDWSIQRDNDCVWRWHSSTVQAVVGGHPKDLDNSILANHTFAVHNFVPTPPTVAITGDSICTGDSVAFSMNTWPCVDSVRWDFDDPPSGSNNTSTDTTTSHTFNNAGSFNVQLFIWSACHVDTVATIVTVMDHPVVDIGPDSVICPGDSVLLDAGHPGSLYNWSTGAFSQSIFAKNIGQYSVIVDSSGCIGYDTMNIGIQSIPAVDLGNDTVLCPGETVTLDAGNMHNNYVWQNGAIGKTHLVTSQGQYYVDAFIGTCVESDTVQVWYHPTLSIDLGQDTGYCPGTSITLNAGLNWNSYLWSDGSNGSTLLVTSPGTYHVSLTDIGDCPYSDTINIIQYPEPVVDLGPDSSLCENDALVIDAGNPGSTFQWSNGAGTQSITVNSAGTYWVNVVNQFTCNQLDTIEIDYIFLPLDLGPDQSICKGDTAVMVASVPGASYVWAGGQTGNTISTMTPGVYSVTASIRHCSAYDEMRVVVIPLPAVQLRNDTSLCKGEEVLLHAGSGGTDFLWSNFATSNRIIATQTGMYRVDVSNECGIATDSVEITFEDCFCEVYMPNAFTPNGDMTNDIFLPVINCDIVEFSIQIFDRWGMLVFRSNDYNTGWDGRLHGEFMAEGVYVFRMEYVGIDQFGNLYLGDLSGSVTLLR